jgi:hypothetical protein
MSKITEKIGRGRLPGADSPKTLIATAKHEVPGFIEHFTKFEQQMVIGGFSPSTLFTTQGR